MACDHGTSGHPCCDDRACRTRWLVGTTTGEPYHPAQAGPFIVDLLETWQGCWFSFDQILCHTTRIRPDLDEWTVRKAFQRIAERGGGWTGDGRKPGRDWRPVETRPDLTWPSSEWGFELRIR